VLIVVNNSVVNYDIRPKMPIILGSSIWICLFMLSNKIFETKKRKIFTKLINRFEIADTISISFVKTNQIVSELKET